MGAGSFCVMNNAFESAEEGGDGIFSTSTDRLLSEESKDGKDSCMGVSCCPCTGDEDVGLGVGYTDVSDRRK